MAEPSSKDLTVPRTMFMKVSVLVLAAFVAACSSSDSKTVTGPSTPDAASCTVGALSAGSTVQGDLNPATGKSCLENYPWNSGAMLDHFQSYAFDATGGKGYLVSLQANWSNHVELMQGPSGDETIVGIADFEGVEQSTIPFVSNATTNYAVRVGQDDPTLDTENAADTGAYTVRIQSCKAPLATVTDSVSHTDTLMTTDCTDPEGDFNSEDSSLVQLYTIHFAQPGGTRMLYFSVPAASLRVASGGPGYDPYCYFSNCLFFDSGIEDGSSFSVSATDSGTYTMVIGTSSYTSSATPYTITFGAETDAPPSHVTPPPVSRQAGLLTFGKAKSLLHHLH